VTEFIRVQPTRDNRRDFAGWACAQTPKVRTCSASEFAVPHHLFTDVPEPLLIGALVDDHRYVSPDEDAANGTPPPGQQPPASASTAQEAATAAVASSSPEDEHSTAASVLADEAADGQEEPPEGVFPCGGGCDKEFTTERGRDTHRRLKHPEA
jgi:hypothetical protein